MCNRLTRAAMRWRFHRHGRDNSPSHLPNDLRNRRNLARGGTLDQFQPEISLAHDLPRFWILRASGELQVRAHAA